MDKVGNFLIILACLICVVGFILVLLRHATEAGGLFATAIIIVITGLVAHLAEIYK